MQTNSSSTSDRQIIIAALVLSLGGAVALGFGRFAYALLLEPMRTDLNWSYAQAGLIGSANAIGYLAGTMLVGLAVARWGAPLTVRIALVLTSLSLLLTGLLSLFPALLVLRILTGLGGGLIYVGGATVVMNRSGTAGRPPLGLYYSGPGIGIAISGLAVPPLLASLQQDGWRTIWLGMGLIGLLALVLMEPFLRTAEA
ncbi:MAG: YbfB/YjiJ family MFS transporter, partial [Chloroflexia bacterium]|nr:YbfB/YjiJ family MFS transporter [Chloroflexia bacterium]